MKFKNCFILAMLLIVLLSLTTVVASENATDEVLQEDNSLDKLESSVPAEQSASDNVDLSVEMDVKLSKDNDQYNSAGSEVPWTITVKSSGGTAKNTVVRNVLSNNLGYVSHNESRGTYNPSNGIWNVGDLKSSDSATLTIWTKLKVNGTYMNKVYATSDSSDKNMLNNFVILSIKTGSSKITSNITETTDDEDGPSHNPHYRSMIEDRLADEPGPTVPDNKPDPVKPDPVKPGGEEDSNKPSDEQAQNPVEKNMLDNLGSYIRPIFEWALNSDDENSTSKGNPSDSHGDAVKAFDYTKVPILIFLVFILALFAVVAYDKVNNKAQ